MGKGRVRQVIRIRVKKAEKNEPYITCNMCQGTGKLKNWHVKVKK